MNSIRFWKYQGTGNDFVMIDNRAGLPHASESEIKKLCDRRFGIGADGLIYLEKSGEADFRMVYFNSDGRESTFCGNGGRCIVAFAKQFGVFEGNETHFVAKDGLHEGIIKGAQIHLKMRDVTDIRKDDLGYELFTGSPHLVVLVDDLHALDVKREGTKIRYSDRFAKEGINVNFVQRAENELLVRTYERGVEDETLSCGTGVTAVALVAATLGYKSPVHLKTPGGDLSVSYQSTDLKKFSDIFLIGPAEMVFEGEIEV